MATARAIANGNWSATSTWNGGVVPGNGDTVYANGFNVTLDVNVLIGGANNPIVNTGSLVSGQLYEIVNVGGQNWTTLGAASNTAGTIFQSTGAGTSGNLGTARALATLTTATNTAAGATTGGGVFTMPTIRQLTTDIRAGTTTCLNVTATSGTLLLSGIRVIGGSAAGAHGVNTAASSDLASCTFTGGGGGNTHALNNASTGSVNVSASCTFTGGGNNNAFALNNASTGTVNVSASCTFTGGGSSAFALNNASTGTVNVSASCTFTGGGGNNSAFALNNASTGTVNISASCTFTGGVGNSALALNNASTGTLIVTGATFTASAFANAVNIGTTSADVRLSGDFLDHWSGWKAVSGGKWRLGTAPTLGQTRYALAGTTDSYFTEFGSDYGAFGNPVAANVRSGIVYGGGNLTGTCAVPAASSTAFGVPVDNTTGTAVLTIANVQSALTDQGLTSARAGNLDNLDTPVSSRLAPSGTLATVTNLTNAPASVTPADIWSHASRTLTSASGPTAVQIRQEIDANSTKLDAAISSRLAASAYTAPTAAPTAAQIRTEMDTNSTRLANLDATVSSRLASASYQSPITPPTAVQIRQEMDSNSTKLANLDTNVGSRAASGTLAADVTAIKAKTDAINVDRINNTATLSQVGNLLAQANS